MIVKGGYNLTIKMQRKFFDSLPNEKVGHACFEPMVPVYQNGMRQRSGQEAQGFRTEFYKSLSQGQRALFMFFTFYDHAIRSKDEFQRISNHYLSSKIFSAVIKGIEYFKDDSMLYLLSEIEHAFLGEEQNDMLNSHIDELYNRLQEIAPSTLMQIGAYIKENPTEFICFE